MKKEMFKWIFKVIFSMDAFRRYTASVSVINKTELANFYKSTKGFTRKSFMVMSGLNKIVADRANFKRDYSLLILSGENDNHLALRAAQKWHNKEPYCRLKIISNAGHCANMDNHEEFNQVVFDFITATDLKLSC